MDGSEIEVDIEVATADSTQAVLGMLRDYNQRANPEFWEKYVDPLHAPQKLELVAKFDNGEVVGGLLAETAFFWLRVQIMAVREDVRLRGIGGRLLFQAEAEARRRGCQYAYVDTMQYQAPEFYLRLGYVISGRLPDWDSHGHDKLFLTKIL